MAPPTAPVPHSAPARRSAVLLVHPVLAVFLVALVVRTAAAVAIYVRNDGFLFSDERMYATIARQAAAGETSSWDDYTTWLYDHNGAFLRPLTWIFELFGPHVLAGQLFVAVIGAAVAAGTARLALGFLPAAWALVAGGIVALLPSQVLWSSLTLKDALSWLCMVGVALLAAVAARGGRTRAVKALTGLVVTLLVLGYLRQHTMLLALWAVALTAWVGSPRARRERVAGAIILALVFPIVLGLGVGGSTLVRDRAGGLEEQRSLGAVDASTALVAPPAQESAAVREGAAAARAAGDRAAAVRARLADLERRAQATQATTPDADLLKELAEVRREAQVAAAEADRQAREAAARLAAAEAVAAENARLDEAFGADSVTGQVGSNLLYLPVGLSAVVLQPFPWQESRGSAMSLAKLEMLVWYPLLALALVGLLSLRRCLPALLLPVVIGSGAAVMWALVEGNFGTAYRHRGELVWVVALLAAAGGQRLRASGRSRASLRSGESSGTPANQAGAPPRHALDG